MTDDIRDRLAEWIETHRSYDPESFGTIVESLAALVGEMLLAERAAALGAAAQLFDAQARFAVQTGQRGKEMWALNSAYRIRALSPAGWVGVRAEDLAVLKEAAHEALAHYYAPLEELQQYRDRADEIRAAIARMA